MVGLSVGSAVGQSSIADEVSRLVQKPKQEFYPTIDEEYVQMEPQTKIDILVATPGRLMDHINMTNGFSLEHLQYLVGLLEFYCIIHSTSQCFACLHCGYCLFPLNLLPSSMELSV